jgi:spore maturation protein CgeB
MTKENILKELKFMLDFSDGKSLKALIKRLIKSIEENPDKPNLPYPG